MRPDLDPGGERSAYFPLALVAPTDEANLSMINQDAYTEQAHRVAMDRARDTGSRRLPGWSTCSRSQTRTRAPTSP